MAATSSAVSTSLERYYNIIYDQSLSPTGNHLATCDSYGQIGVFDLSSALNVSSTEKDRTSSRVIQGHKGSIYCVEGVQDMLVSGGEEGIKIWKWKKLLNTSKPVKPEIILQPPLSKLSIPDTNGIAYDSQTETLFCGCGDNSIHAWDIQTGKLKGTFSGHSDYVHCVCMRTGTTQFLSGAEDGTVRIWDPSVSKKAVQVLQPVKSSGGQWVGCVAMDTTGDWLVCGGSMGPTFFHLSSPSTATKIATMQLPAGATTQAALFVNDRIITGGSGSDIRHWSINGELISCVPSGLGHVFSLIYNNKNKKNEVLTVSGDSADVNVFTNLGYTAFSLSVTSLPIKQSS